MEMGNSIASHVIVAVLRCHRRQLYCAASHTSSLQRTAVLSTVVPLVVIVYSSAVADSPSLRSSRCHYRSQNYGDGQCVPSQSLLRRSRPSTASLVVVAVRRRHDIVALRGAGPGLSSEQFRGKCTPTFGQHVVIASVEQCHSQRVCVMGLSIAIYPNPTVEHSGVSYGRNCCRSTACSSHSAGQHDTRLIDTLLPQGAWRNNLDG
eukprot:gene9955-biopygen89